MSKIAFLFLTIDNVYYPQIWERYFQECPLKKSIYVHPKYPEKVSVTWMKNNIIKDLVPTNWGYLTDAFYQLLKTAIKDNTNSHFIFISDSCLPIRKLSTLSRYIQKFPSETSFIHFKDSIDDYDREKKIKRVSGYQNYQLQKHEGLGNCLSRHHVGKLLDHRQDFQLFFNKLNCGDEYYLSLLGNDQTIHDQQMTYYNWEQGRQQVETINQKMESIYQQAEQAQISKINQQMKTLKKNQFPGHQKKIKALKISLKKIQKGQNENLLTSKQLVQLKKLRILKSKLGKHPQEYRQISISEVKKLRTQGFFFLRKISRTHFKFNFNFFNFNSKNFWV